MRPSEPGEDFQLLLTRYANERFLYRLAQSPHSGQFVLKGAALFTVWTGAPHRATRDLDLLGSGDPSEARLRTIFLELMQARLEDDGVEFDARSLEVGPIREDQIYGGIRALVTARIATAQIRLQIDVGFGDAITPAPIEVAFPHLLDFPAPRLHVYPRETVVAEKLEAMVQLGLANSRMKDFYDLVILSRLFEFDGDLLVRAIRATFERRGTPLPVGLPVALTAAFGDDPAKQTQWRAFMRKADAHEVESLVAAIAATTAFVREPVAAAATSAGFRSRWVPRGPWA